MFASLWVAEGCWLGLTEDISQKHFFSHVWLVFLVVGVFAAAKQPLTWDEEKQWISNLIH
jgi:hypothetical protein